MTMKNNLVRIVLRVTPEEKQKMTVAAGRDDRTLTLWAIRALRVASEDSACVWPVAPPAPQVALVATSGYIKCDAAPVVPGKAVGIAPQVVTIAPQGISGNPARGYKEYLASGGVADDCTTVGGSLRVRATGEPLDINR